MIAKSFNFHKLILSVCFIAIAGVVQLQAQLKLNIADIGGTVTVSITTDQVVAGPLFLDPGRVIYISAPSGTPITGFAALGAAYTLNNTTINNPACDPSLEYFSFVPTASGVPVVAAGQTLSPGSFIDIFQFNLPVPNCLGAISLHDNSAGSCASSFFSSIAITGPGGMFTSNGNITGAISCDPNSPLPVELISFEATAQGNEALLTWETGSELDNAGFTVQRSADGANWDDLGWVVGKGTTSQAASYEFVDGSPQNGQNYYRLEQRDHDGSTELSDIRSLIFGSGPQLVRAFPNPTEGLFILDMPGYSNGEVQIRATDATGRVVFQQHNIDFSNTRQELDFSGLAPGVYQLNVRFPLGDETIPLMIMRD